MIGICEDLRKSVLQAAIQGKLTQQLSEDGDAETLYAEIQKEKQKLVKEGKIKKEKPLPEITEDDIPFDIPENWKWCRLQDIALKITDGTHHSPPNGPNGDYMYVSAKNIKDNGISLENITYVTKSVHDEIYSRCNPEFCDVLLIKDGATAGVVTVNNIKEPFSMLSSVALIKVDSSFVDSWYLAYTLRSDLLYSIVREIMKGTGIPRITLKQIYPLVLPLPPLAEQKRIVARVDELMKRIDEMEKTEKDITALYDAFPGDMKASLLQAAIQGKFTEQLASDGDAETLYQDIQKEKQRLIKEGKIKKEKPLPEITEDDIPFDIPENWKFIKLGHVIQLIDGIKQENRKLPYLEAKYIRGRKEADFISKGKYVEKDTFVILVDGENSGEVFQIHENGYLGSTFKILYIPDCINSRYIVYYLKLYQNLLRDNKKGAAIPHLQKELFFNLVLPLPPLVEQKRIVEKLDYLLPLCDSMKEAIDATA